MSGIFLGEGGRCRFFDKQVFILRSDGGGWWKGWGCGSTVSSPQWSLENFGYFAFFLNSSKHRSCGYEQWCLSIFFWGGLSFGYQTDIPASKWLWIWHWCIAEFLNKLAESQLRSSCNSNYNHGRSKCLCLLNYSHDRNNTSNCLVTT